MQPGEVVRGAGAPGLAPTEQRWTGRQPAVVDEARGAMGVELLMHAPGPQRYQGYVNVPTGRCPGKSGQPRGDSLFPHLADTPTHCLLLEALHRFQPDPVVAPPTGLSHISGTKEIKTHTPLTDVAKATAPKVIVDDGHVYLVTHYPQYGDGSTNNKCWVKECKARVTYNLLTKEVVRNDTEHLGIQCSVDEYLRSKKKKSDIEDVEVCLSEMLQDEPFLKPDVAYQRLLKMQAVSGKKFSVTPRHVRYVLNKLRPKQCDGSLDRILEDLWHPGQHRLWVRCEDRQGLVMFMTDKHEQILARSQMWQVDATYQACPNGWVQLLNIMAVDESYYQYWPAAHILMKGRTAKDYREAFLRLLVSFRNPAKLALKRVSTDFEWAMREGFNQAVEQMKFEVQFIGCLFHYAQALLRNWKSLYKQRKMPEEAWTIFNIVMAFPYLDLSICERWLRELRSKQNPCPEFVQYFWNQWMKHTSWWHHGNDISTNCALEGFHGNMKSCFTLSKPTLPQLSQSLYEVDMQVLKKLEERIDTEKIRDTVGKRVKDNTPLLFSKMDRIIKNLPDKPTGISTPVPDLKEVEPVTTEQVVSVIQEFLDSLSRN